jgi:hypothetical protein
MKSQPTPPRGRLSIFEVFELIRVLFAALIIALTRPKR